MFSPVYLRKESTSCTLTLAQPAPLVPSQRDVVAYQEPGGRVMGRWPWHYSNKPTRRNRRVTLNCVTRPIVWLDDL